jgi:alpha-ketoglutarate-dependent taurine dioxygenase
MTTRVAPMLDKEIAGDVAWTRAQLSRRDWEVPVPKAAVHELDAALEQLRRAPAPLESLRPEAFRLETCAGVMRQVHARLVQGVGMAIVDRVQVERYTIDENRIMAWLLASLLGRVVAQKQHGVFLYDVRDTGKSLEYGVRRSLTNLAQPFHTDGPWLTMAPAFVGLFCLQSAHDGGLSRYTSLVTAHNELRKRHPELLARLYQPFHWDRQAEHGPDEPRFATHPVFAFDGRALSARYYEDYVVKGYTLAGKRLDEMGRDALAAMREVVDAPAHWTEFRIETGQFQYLNNGLFAHSRTQFSDAPGSDSRRHMIRVWNRDEGTSDLEGASEPARAARGPVRQGFTRSR